MKLPLSHEKTEAARAIADVLVPGQRVCLTTHVNPDGDGLGSEVGLLHLLKAQGITAVVTNPTATPPRFDFLFEGLAGADRSREAIKELRRADVIVVLDIADLGRLGMLGDTVRDRGVPVVCIDHHVSPGELPAGAAVRGPRGGGHRRTGLRDRPGRTAGRSRARRRGRSTWPS